jgi:hypothetical protein
MNEKLFGTMDVIGKAIVMEKLRANDNIEIVTGDFSPVLATQTPPDSPTLTLSPPDEVYDHVHFNRHLAKGGSMAFLLGWGR